ncbi:uncharacterized protein LOC131673234 [Phymastichus coffea]|uniref:uncharacterized protein LOC131673234 n=1 Tax=Phymastichus coffea TaxID=108790 RepID=UPI00273C0C11|nr:uncharacterized protein LOC131673234 [Phymastichus coffea]
MELAVVSRTEQLGGGGTASRENQLEIRANLLPVPRARRRVSKSEEPTRQRDFAPASLAGPRGRSHVGRVGRPSPREIGRSRGVSGARSGALSKWGSRAARAASSVSRLPRRAIEQPRAFGLNSFADAPTRRRAAAIHLLARRSIDRSIDGRRVALGRPSAAPDRPLRCASLARRPPRRAGDCARHEKASPATARVSQRVESRIEPSRLRLAPFSAEPAFFVTVDSLAPAARPRRRASELGRPRDRDPGGVRSVRRSADDRLDGATLSSLLLGSSTAIGRERRTYSTRRRPRAAARRGISGKRRESGRNLGEIWRQPARDQARTIVRRKRRNEITGVRRMD